jgi:hypothetical protein
MTGRLLLVAGVMSAAPGWCGLPLPIFGDVPVTAPYFHQVNLLRERLITTGCTLDPQMYCPEFYPYSFSPYYLTRGQAAVLIIRSLYSGLSGNPENFTAPTTPYFQDVQPGHGQFVYIQKLKELGITSGCTATDFCPDRGVSYGELTVFVYRARQKKLAGYEYATVWPPASCSDSAFNDVPAGHIFCPYIKSVSDTVGPENARSPECPWGNFCPDVVFEGNQAVSGIQVRRGPMAFYLVKGILNATHPEALPTSNGELPALSPPSSCSYEQPIFQNYTTLVGGQLYGYSLTALVSFGDRYSFSFTVASSLLENQTEKYPRGTTSIAGAAAWRESPWITYDPAKDYQHNADHLIAAPCAPDGGIPWSTKPWPTLLSVNQPTLYRGTQQSLSLRGITLEGTQSVFLSSYGTISSSVSNISPFGATATIATPLTAPSGQAMVSITSQYQRGGQQAAELVSSNWLPVTVADPTPVLNPLTPSSVEQGSVVSMTLTGTNFGLNPKVCINSACTNGNNTQTTSNNITLAQGQCNPCGGQIPITLTIPTNATPGSHVIVVLSQGGIGGFFQAPQGGSTPQSGAQGLQVRERPQTVSQVAKYNGTIVDPLYLSTGDTSGRIITTSVVPSNATFDATYTQILLSNPNSSCNATLSVPNGSATGFINSPVSAGQAGCSGIFSVRARANGVDSLNTSAVIVPPQILIQMLYGEANGQPRKAVNPDFVSQPALGVATRNRFAQTGWGGVTTYQAAITPLQFMGIATSVLNGPDPELRAAAEVYSGVTNVSVLDAGCFFTPTVSGWNAIQAAYQNQDAQVPSVSFDPRCYQADPVNYPYGRQLVIKTTIGLNASGNGAPAFIFERPRPQASDPAVIEIP